MLERGTIGRELVIAAAGAVVGVVVLRVAARWEREDAQRERELAAPVPGAYNVTADLRGEGPYRRRY